MLYQLFGESFGFSDGHNGIIEYLPLIRCKFLFYKGEQAILSVGSCLQSEWYLQQVQGTLL